MKPVVHLLAVATAPTAELAPPPLEGLAGLVAAVLERTTPPDGPWLVKTSLGPPGRPAAVTPGWTARVAAALPGGVTGACVDTLSITTAPLQEPAGHAHAARAKGYGSGGPAPAYRVADDPALGASPQVDGIGLAAGAAGAAGLAVLTPVRPHPHLGFSGALASLGLGLVDQATKLSLHADIRPQVDTPLCAGCGSCLAVCIYDAIVIRAGRSWIDHELCTGCGECMNACFMAGIAPEDAAGIVRFQERVATAAAAARRGTVAGTRPAIFLNFLMRRDRGAGGPARRRKPLGDLGVLAGTDPVAVDVATRDLIAEHGGGSVAAWSGFSQGPDELLHRAEELGLGAGEYRLLRRDG